MAIDLTVKSRYRAAQVRAERLAEWEEAVLYRLPHGLSEVALV